VVAHRSQSPWSGHKATLQREPRTSDSFNDVSSGCWGVETESLNSEMLHGTSRQAILIGQCDSPASTIPSRGFVKGMSLDEYRHAACPHPRQPQGNRRRMPSCEMPITGTTPYASPLVACLIIRSDPVAKKSFYQPASLRHEATNPAYMAAQPHGSSSCLWSLPFNIPVFALIMMWTHDIGRDNNSR